MNARTRTWLPRIGLAVLGLGMGTIVGHIASAARQGLDLFPVGPEHVVGLGVGVLVSLWIAADV